MTVSSHLCWQLVLMSPSLPGWLAVPGEDVRRVESADSGQADPALLSLETCGCSEVTGSVQSVSQHRPPHCHISVLRSVRGTDLSPLILPARLTTTTSIPLIIYLSDINWWHQVETFVCLFSSIWRKVKVRRMFLVPTVSDYSKSDPPTVIAESRY